MLEGFCLKNIRKKMIFNVPPVVRSTRRNAATWHWTNCTSVLYSFLLVRVKLNATFTLRSISFYIFSNALHLSVLYTFSSSILLYSFLSSSLSSWWMSTMSTAPHLTVGPIFSPSCSRLRGCVKMGTACVCGFWLSMSHDLTFLECR